MEALKTNGTDVIERQKKGTNKMKFKLTRSSDWKFDNPRNKEIEINTLEELLNLCRETNCSLIVDEGSNGEKSIEIYDDFRE